jgi:hypothetical protein
LVSQARRRDADNRPRLSSIVGARKIGKAIQVARRAVSISLLYVGWQPGATLSLTGYVAMAVGLVAAILLGIGIVLLIHHDKRDR